MIIDPTPRVSGLQIALAARLPMRAVERIEIETGAGIVGDRYHGSTHRHVTVQSLEEISDAETDLGRRLQAIDTRRNVTLSHGRLDRTPGAQLRIGDVVLEVVRDAAPCKLLEDALGRDAKLALHKRAGVVYRTLEGGAVELGDAVEL